MEKFIQENAKIIRYILGYTQADMAKVLGVSRPYLGGIESGKVDVNRTVAIAFITVVILISNELEEDSIRYALMDTYVNELSNFMKHLI